MLVPNTSSHIQYSSVTHYVGVPPQLNTCSGFVCHIIGNKIWFHTKLLLKFEMERLNFTLNLCFTFCGLSGH